MHNSHRRLLLQAIAASWMLSVSKIGFATSVHIVAIRVWPASTYTRITLESNLPLKYRQFTLSKPDRIVVDIEDVHLNEVLREMTRQVQATDPHLKQVRVGQFNKKPCG
ncbi:localization of periplasmic protein complexes [Candidatus Regiella insecticola 5.15]|uniref:Localization of periplasmic protein complexes n=1 Tax=Candidatus Regiella insecticola 5.15 TaxID=1005043 RepID=G2GYE9_9ENTR|nr:localization of periplasmic protein complexes [Candidatus Regiella insecticola 5.15]